MNTDLRKAVAARKQEIEAREAEQRAAAEREARAAMAQREAERLERVSRVRELITEELTSEQLAALCGGGLTLHEHGADLVFHDHKLSIIYNHGTPTYTAPSWTITVKRIGTQGVEGKHADLGQLWDRLIDVLARL